MDEGERCRADFWVWTLSAGGGGGGGDAEMVWCGAVLLWSLRGKWQLGPLGLRSGKKKHNFLFYFP